MNPDDLIISTDYSGVTVSVDDYWNEMTLEMKTRMHLNQSMTD